MQWGMPSLVEFDNIDENIGLCRKLGLNFIELNMNLPMFQPELIEKLPRSEDFFYTIHMDENFCPADFNPLIAKAWMETMCSTIRAAVKIGAPVINMHMSKGVYFTLPEKKVYLFERYRDGYFEQIQRLREICEKEIGEAPVRICIENTGGYADFQKQAIDLLLESDCFALTWDLGHWHKGRIDDGPFMTERRERIRHFHVHDAGTAGDHLPLGEGNVDLNGMLRFADACGARCVLETKTSAAMKSSVDWLRGHGWL